MLDVDVVVIGSGAGGMTAAVTLANAGKRVLVVEQHELPGGWCHSFNLGKYRFSPGVHYVGEVAPGGVLREIYEGLGVADDLTFLELDPDGYDRARVGATHLDFPKGREALAARLSQRFPDEAPGIRAYLDTIQQIAGDLRGLAALANDPKALLRYVARSPALLRHGARSLASFQRSFLRDPRLRNLLAVQSGDHGMRPSRAATALHAAVTAHYFDGGYYPKGGAGSLPKAFLKQLKRQGGDLMVRATVARILVERAPGGPRAVGVRLVDGTEIRARHVVSNADPHATFDRLVDPEHVPWTVRQRLARTRYSVSSLILFMASKVDLRQAGMTSGNVWWSRGDDVEAMYDYGQDGSLGPPPGMFLTATTLKDPSKYRGVHTLEAIVLVHGAPFARWAGSEHGARPADYEALKANLTAQMLDTVDTIAPGVKAGIELAELGTPVTNTHYVASTAGNIYGTEKSRLQLGPLAWPVHTAIRGLRLCGASTVGHGVAGATMSGVIAAGSILKLPRDGMLDRSSRLTVLPADPRA
jgi:phytoene dehydrogenase-like protein